MNPLDTKLRRNRFSGYSARPGINALAKSNWGKKNPGGIPVPKLGIVWNSLINGLRLIESISEEVADKDIFESVESNLAELPSEVNDLLQLYSESVSGNFGKWAESKTTEDARKLSYFLEGVNPSPLSRWLRTTSLTENSSDIKTWFLFEGGKALESSLRSTLRAYGQENL